MEQFQEYLSLKPHNILRCSQTRWLSLSEDDKRILDKWDVLNLDTAKPILECLNDPVVKMYFLFLNYTLPFMMNLNLTFQSESRKIHLILTTVAVAQSLKIILKNFLMDEYVDRTPMHEIDPTNIHNHKPEGLIYFGAKAIAIKMQVTKTELS